MTRAPQAPPFSRSLAWSLAAHGSLLLLLFLIPHLGFFSSAPELPPLEIDINSNFLGTGPAKLGAPKPATKGTPALVNATAEKAPEPVKPPPPVKAVEPPKDWVLPGPDTKKVEAPPPPAATGSARGSGDVTTSGGSPGGEGTAAKTGGSGLGADEGEIDGTGDGGAALSRFPRLINKDEVLAAMSDMYPEAERRANREGNVGLALHIGADGRVSASDVKQSSGATFDAAAQRIAKIMRFSPALDRQGRPVRVKLAQPISFRLN